MRRAVLSLIAATVLVLFAVAPAAAHGKPSREFSPLPDELLIPSGESCDFEVSLTFPANKEYLLTFFDASGDPIRETITGKLVVTVTNTETGESVVVNASGPAHFDLVAEEFIANGHLLQWYPGALFLHAGRYDLATNEGKGRILLDLCDELSA